MERIVCLVIGYIFGLFQTGYLYGKAHHVDIRKQEAATQEQRMHSAQWAGKQER